MLLRSGAGWTMDGVTDAGGSGLLLLVTGLDVASTAGSAGSVDCWSSVLELAPVFCDVLSDHASLSSWAILLWLGEYLV